MTRPLNDYARHEQNMSIMIHVALFNESKHSTKKLFSVHKTSHINICAYLQCIGTS